MPHHGSKHRKRRNRRRTQQKTDTVVEVIETSEDYRVESPKTVQKKKEVVKSKSLDSDETLRITELSECETETEAESTAIVAEADEVKTSVVPREMALLSPEEEVHLRQFIVGLDLVNSAEEAAKVVENRNESSSTTKSKRAKKREQIAQYFLPVYQNPRFLDAISEEGSDSSDRETLRVRIIEGPTIEEVVCRTETAQSIERPEIVHLDEDESSASDSQQTPPPTPDVDSSGSDSTNRSSPVTTLENPMTSSVGDVASLLQDPQPLTLKDICLKRMVTLPFGDEVLEELAETAHHLIPDSFPAAPNPNDDDDSSRLLDLIRNTKMHEETYTSNYQFVPTKSRNKQEEEVFPPQKDAIYKTTSNKNETSSNSNKRESKEFIIKTVLENKEANGKLIKSEADLKKESCDSTKTLVEKDDFHKENVRKSNEKLVNLNGNSKEVIIKTVLENKEANGNLIKSEADLKKGSCESKTLVEKDVFHKENLCKSNEKLVKMNGNLKEVIIKTVVEKDKENASKMNGNLNTNQASNLNKSKSQSVDDVMKNQQKEFLIKTVMENSKPNQLSNLNKSKSQSLNDQGLTNRERCDSKEVIIKTVVENSSNLNKSKSQSVGDVKEKSGSKEFIIKTVLEKPEVERSNLNKFFSQSDFNNHSFDNDTTKSKEVIIKTVVEKSTVDGSSSNELENCVMNKSGSNLKKFLSQSESKNHSFDDNDTAKSNEVIIKTVVEKSSDDSKMSKSESVKNHRENLVKTSVEKPKFEESNLNKFFSQSVGSDLKNHSLLDDKTKSKEVFIKTVVEKSSDDSKMSKSESVTNNVKNHNLVKTSVEKPKFEESKFLSQSVGSDLKNHSLLDDKTKSKEVFIKTIVEKSSVNGSSSNVSKSESVKSTTMEKPKFEGSNLNKFFSQSVGNDLKNYSFGDDKSSSKEVFIKTVVEKSEVNGSSSNKSGSNLNKFFSQSVGSDLKNCSLNDKKSNEFVIKTVLEEPRKGDKSRIDENSLNKSGVEGSNLNKFFSKSDLKNEKSNNSKEFVIKTVLEKDAKLEETSGKKIETLSEESNLKKFICNTEISESESRLKQFISENCKDIDASKLEGGNLKRFVEESSSTRKEEISNLKRFASESDLKIKPKEFTIRTILEEEDDEEDGAKRAVGNLQRLMNEARSKAQNLGEWLETATTTSRRRRSLPHEFYVKQMQYLIEKEKKIQEELESLEMEKRKLNSDMFTAVPVPLNEFEPEAALKKGRPKSTPSVEPHEKLRQEMYDEYMDKVAEREERKHHKIIKISLNEQDDILANGTEEKATNELEKEFLDKARQRLVKGGVLLLRDDSDEIQQQQQNHHREVLILDGDEITASDRIPKHLRELIDQDGVWSPGQQRNEESRAEEQQQQQRRTEGGEPIPPVWTPRSAGSSPTAERKEFRPVNFESPVLGRKTRTKSDGSATLTQEAGPSWKAEPKPEARIPTSFSAPGPGFSDCSRLPKAQNPTITLLQKAREGQIPKASSALEQEKQQRCAATRSNEPPNFSNDPVHQVRSGDCVSDSDGERPKTKIAINSNPSKKYEGIGPTTKDGMPITLRSEVRDTNMSQWYKKMYDTIHKQKPSRYDDDEYVTVRYKQRRGRYPYTTGYLSEPEPGAYDSDATMSDCKYATLDRRRPQPPPNQDHGMSSTLPRNASTTTIRYRPSDVQHANDVYKNQPGRIENYQPGKSSISEHEAKKWWDEVMDIFDGWLDDHSAAPSCNYLLNKAIVRSHLEQQKRMPTTKGYMSQALKESGYESDSPLVFRRRDDTAQLLSALEQREVYRNIQRGGEVPIHGLRKPAPERPKESPRKYVENEVTIHYRTPVRQEVKEALSEDELAKRQADAMRKIYEDERRRKYLQELHDMKSRRHTDNFIPSQKSPIALNRYDDFMEELSPRIKPRPRSPEPRLVARALYNFVGQTSRELTFKKGDVIHIRRQVDKNWYEGEINAMVGLFPANYVEIVPYDGIKTTPRKSHEGQARAKYNFIAQTHLELSLAKGELVVITRRVDDNWFEGKIGGRKGIFPVSYVEVLIDPSDPPQAPTKPVASPAAHSMLLNGSSGGKESMGTHSYVPTFPTQDLGMSYRAKPVQVSGYSSLKRNPVEDPLHIETHSEPIPYRALYKYKPQNEDELELLEGDTVYVLEKCDDGWYVGSSDRTGAFGTFPGNYVDRI
ncbi:PREDICTED: uncharacterized protein LOC108560112 isoform X2 [Nicrophorus vespilloides]|uniref:Uncharacterized protein LOC108560112 isoform X2 n=1 Tax=Nicrophorus vespilloides TaxID=110193 RepID=A0ABM1MER3_NICVS|nr:PREDICTED: uncharacterized protein LOC108560112 isoform X2 [Nicrophorus vespilloides]